MFRKCLDRKKEYVLKQEAYLANPPLMGIDEVVFVK